ncbi:MAG TPA: MBL fold metallo-hydrolase [Bryobacteraceae bacterium]|nr:MBL fold metallo-hydrolase [Bryobacteraceae bacterium]
MQILPDVFEIASHFGNRWVKQYLLVGDTVVLLDTGVAATPAEAIFPYLEKIGVPPSRISLAIALHADSDHHGGFPAIKDASPGTQLACHRADRALIEDPEALYRDRYNFLAQDHGLGFGREGLVYCPEGRKMDVVFSGGETIRLAKDWNLRVWHVPGHSAGHLAIYDEKNHAAFTSDAVQSAGYPTIDGKMAFGPTYYTVDAYLATARFLEDQPIEHMFSGHWPDLHASEVHNFLCSTRDFVFRADELLVKYLHTRPRGATLREIIGELSPQLGPWPPEMAPFLQFALYGHVARMEQNGTLRAEHVRPVVYRMA